MGATPAKVKRPATGKSTVGLAAAVDLLVGYTAEDLVTLVEVRKVKAEAARAQLADYEARKAAGQDVGPVPNVGPGPADVPAPVGEDAAGGPVWDLGHLHEWGLRMGAWRDGWRGTPVIGYAGAAKLLGVTEQALRKLTWQAERRGEGRRVDDIPRPWRVINRKPIMVVLFDSVELRRWATQTGRLKPDGTPQKLRPGRKPRTG